jgi:hypothetical protein
MLATTPGAGYISTRYRLTAGHYRRSSANRFDFISLAGILYAPHHASGTASGLKKIFAPSCAALPQRVAIKNIFCSTRTLLFLSVFMLF